MVSSHIHSASQSCLYFIPYFLQIIPITYVCFVYFAAIAQVCINFHRQHIWQWWCERRAKSHVSKEISGRGRTRSRGVKGNQGVGDFRFINILQFFSIYYYYYYYFLSFFPYFFTHDIYPHPHPRPTTSTHYPRPTTFSYTPFIPEYLILRHKTITNTGTIKNLFGTNSTILNNFSKVILQLSLVFC